MSTIIVIEHPDAAYLITDAGHYHPETGEIVEIKSKVMSLPCGVAITHRGFCGDWPNMLYRRLYDVPSFDRVIGEIQGIAQYVYGRCVEEMGPEDMLGHQHFEITLAGYSESGGRPGVVQLSSRGGARGEAPHFLNRSTVPFELIEPGPLNIAPGGFDPSDAIGRLLPLTVDGVLTLDPERDGLAMIEAQRRVGGRGTSVNWPTAAGFAELTTVTKAGIIRKKLKTWPDKVGHQAVINANDL